MRSVKDEEERNEEIISRKIRMGKWKRGGNPCTVYGIYIRIHIHVILHINIRVCTYMHIHTYKQHAYAPICYVTL